MRGDIDSERVGTQVSNLTKKLDRSFRVTAFEFAVRGAHAAEGLQAAMGADSLPFAFGLANVLQLAVPALRKAAFAEVVAIAVGDHANGQLPLRINGATILAPSASVFFRAMGLWNGSLFGFRHFFVLGLTNGVTKIECDHLFGGKAYRQGALRAIGSRIDERIEFEFDAQVLLGKALHFVHFVKIDGGGDGLELKRKIAFAEQTNALHAAIVGTGNPSECFVGFACGAVEGDFNGKGTVFNEVIRDPGRDHCAVGEEGDEKAALLCFGVNIEKIFAGKNLSAGVENPKATNIDEFIEKVDVLVEGHFPAACLGIVHGEIVVAMLAFEGAAMRYFDRHFHGSAATHLALVDLRGKLPICGGL